MGDAIIELFSEEIPARMQQKASAELKSRIEKMLRENNLQFDDISSFVTPRRIAVLVRNLPEKQPDMKVEKKGPKVGAPDAAIDGFCKSAGVSRGDLEIREIGGKEFYMSLSEIKGKPAKEALGQIFEESLANFPWPKSQRWGASEIFWVRPLKRILCLFDEDIIPVEFGHIKASNITEGHRFLGSNNIEISIPSDYESALKDNYVIADHAQRKQLIKENMSQISTKNNVKIIEDEALLNEVAGLVEWPACLLGKYDKSFLSLPEEVLILEMKHHQKYFACVDEQGEISNHFIVVANILPEDGGKAIIDGNQRVLRARLSDGEFYWERDRTTPLDSLGDKLEKMIFHADLGTMNDKVARIGIISDFICRFVVDADRKQTVRAAAICKSDLVSGMVGEFPELQGVMGRYYAIAQKESLKVADAIGEHYKPAGADDSLPDTPESTVLSLADKVDSLAGLFAAGERPTGSKDPFALRRMVLGILRIIMQDNIRIDLKELFDFALQQYGQELFADKAKEDIIKELLIFAVDRLKVILKSDGVRHDVIESVCSDIERYDIVLICKKINAIGEFIAKDEGEELITSYRRAANIVAKEKAVIENTNIDESILSEVAEKELYEAIDAIKPEIETEKEKENFARAMAKFLSLKVKLDAFFENVTINADDEKIRMNRLSILMVLSNMTKDIGNFSLIENQK